MTKITQTWKTGDCEDLMREMEPDSVDLIVTDPPYGYSFMGKDWDKAVPSTDLWKAALRVLKPGAFAFIMSAPRQDVLAHNLVNLSDAGFETGFTSIYWTYSSGFPKAGNIGKLVDKRNGRTPCLEFKNYINKKRKDKGVSLNEINKSLGVSTTGGGVASLLMGNKKFNELPTSIIYKKLKNILDLDNRFDELIGREEAEREVIGKKEKLNGYSNIGFSSGSGKYDKTTINTTIPATPQAKELDGSYGGFQPKPAVEVIMCVMKPLSESTYVDQALANGKGITWLDDGRIPYQSDKDIGDPERFKVGWSISDSNDGRKRESHKNYNHELIGSKGGRFPANLLVSDDVLNGDDNESFSRHFDLDEWFDTKYLPKKSQKTFPFMITPKAGKSEKGGAAHPTIKPVKLMSWLITIGSREGNLVIDPFLGSGTTLEAGRITNRNIVGFEIDPQWEKYYAERAMTNTPTLNTFW